MAFASPFSCSRYHNTATGYPDGVGIHRLESPSVPSGSKGIIRSILDKLKTGDVGMQEQLKKWHGYAFNLGNGSLFTDYYEAQDALMERNLSDIYHDKQRGAIYIPETDLPKVPRAVNIDLQNKDLGVEEYEGWKSKLPQPVKKFLNIKTGTEEKQNLEGELVEQELLEAFKAEYNDPNIEVVVLQGPTFKTPDSAKGTVEEHDFIIVSKKHKYVLGVESKRTLNNGTLKDSFTQLARLQSLLNSYLGDELSSGEWLYIGMIHFDRLHYKVSLCQDCEKFALNTAGELHTKLAQAEASLHTMRPSCTPSHDEYKIVVKTLAFTVLAHPMPTKALITKEVYNKIVGKASKKKNKEPAPGQGDLKSILFWTPSQASLMLSQGPSYVAFISSWSCGKTLCMREMARRRATMCPKQTVYFCIVRDILVKKKSLLELELDQVFRDLPNVTVTAVSAAANDALKELEELIKTKAGSWFIDELTLPRPDEHSSVSPRVQGLVQLMKNQPDQPLLWIAVAGIWEGKPEHFSVAYLKALLDPLHVVEGMDSPLRNSLATLRLANLETGTSANPLAVAGNYNSNVLWTIPHKLIPGVEGLTFIVQDRDDGVEVEDKVRQAREAMAARLGHAGLPVLCSYVGSDQYKWTMAGLAAARPGTHTLLYTRGAVDGQSQASEVQVAEWINKMDSGHQEEDLITDEFLSRGWESQSVLVVDLRGSLWKNLVVRAMAHCIVVRCDDNDSDSDDDS